MNLGRRKYQEILMNTVGTLLIICDLTNVSPIDKIDTHMSRRNGTKVG